MQPPRPLVSVALALALGALAGAHLDVLPPWARGGSGTVGAVPALLGGVAIGALAALVRAWSARRLPPRAVPWAVCVLAALACARAARARAEQPPAHPGAPVEEPRGTRGLAPDAAPGAPVPGATGNDAPGPWTGVWRARGGRGLLAPDVGAAPAVLAEADCAPRDGERIALLPGARVMPWAAGPERGPLGREGRTRAALDIPLDLLVRRAPPARAGLLSSATEFVARARAALERRLARFEARAGLDGLGGALLLGRRDGLDHERVDRFTRTGTRHLLAVSGLHVGLLFGLAAGLLARLARARPQRWRRSSAGSERGRACGAALAGLTLLGAYAILAGAAAPVSRAALMLGFGLAAPTTIGGGRRADGWSLLAAAFALEVVLDPLAPVRPGTSLSYLATLGLMLAPRRGSTPGVHALVAPSAPRLAARLAAGLARRGVVASTAATLATLPVAATTFGELAPLGVLLTPLCVPLLGVLLAALLVGLALPDVAPTGIASAAASALEGLLACADRLPGTPVPVPPRPFWLVAVAAWCGLWAWRRGRAGALPGRVAALAGAALLLPWSAYPAELEIVVLDVGHGTACAVRGPGLPALVVDAGSRDRPRVASEALGPLLARWDPGTLGIVVTHADLDHAACIPWLRSRRPPDWILGAVPAHPGEREPHNLGPLEPGPGSFELRVGPDLVVRVVRGLAEAGNEGSLGVELVAPTARAVLLGDAEGPGLAAMLRRGLAEGPVDLLLMPHHGSDTPLLGALLDRLAPRLVWISAGEEPAIARELDRRGVRWRWTGGAAAGRSAGIRAASREGECGLLFRARPGGSFPSPGGR